ncbi:MAG: restriction endonuclease subunit S [Candidatus Omnitrophica bacterium]|nr:restriction endonuclease subunit S [Candidatus Omnitrophota bacterium]
MAEWEAINTLFDYEKGTLQSSKCTPGKYAFITAAEGWKTHDIFTHDCEALIFAMAASGSLGRTHYVNGKFISSDLCFILTPKNGLRLDLAFYYRLFNFLRADIVKKTATGTSKLAINQTNFGAYKLPYFDYDHQLRFRGKIETITGINEEFFKGMNYQLSLITKLRQAVLQDAIEGKLTAEWRKQNPHLISGEKHASRLLEKIKAAKDQLIKDGGIRESREISNSTTIRDMQIPVGWAWAKGEDIFFVTKLAGFEYTKYINLKESGKVPVIRAQNVRPLQITTESLLYIDLETSKILERSALTKECLLVTFIGAGIGDVATFHERDRWHLAPNVAKMEPYGERSYLSLRYLNYYLMAKTGQREIFKHVKATAQPCLSMGTIRDIDYLIPPIAEQKAIVERVDELMAMINDLKKQVTDRKGQSELLMQSVLREAFQ